MKVKIKYDDDTGTATVRNGDESYVLFGVHKSTKCVGTSCVIHNPSKHEFRKLPLVWEDGQFWRVLPWITILSGEPMRVVDPDAQTFQDSFSGPKIKCGNCDDVIQSKHVHDFVTCKCGATSIDGGSDYTRILGSQWGWFSNPESGSVQ